MFGYIYKITLPNGRCYVGCKKKATFDENYWSSSCNPEFWKDLNFYGKENCKREILEWIDNQENIAEREDYWILHENAFIKQGGYNLAKSCHPFYQTKETREKISKARLQQEANLTQEQKLHKQTINRTKSINNWKTYSKEKRNFIINNLHQSYIKWINSLSEAERQQLANRNKNISITYYSQETLEQKQNRIQKIKDYNNNLTEIQKLQKSQACKERTLDPDGIYQSKEYKEKMSKILKEVVKQKGGTWNKGYHWYTNGTINICAKECPEGFKLGRLRKKPMA